MKKEIIGPRSQPYSQGVKVGNLVFFSGLSARDTDEVMYAPGDIRQQTERALEKLKERVESAGSSLENVVKINVYIDDITKKPQFHAVYKEFFSKDGPARTTIQVSRFDGGMCIEIDAVALVPES